MLSMIHAIAHSDGGDVTNHVTWLDGSPHGALIFAIGMILHLVPHFNR